MGNSPGEEHAAFTQWAVSHGIKIKGIAPARFPGRRLGMIATRDIEENEIMLSIPVSLMLTLDSIPESFVSMFPEGTSTQGVLAAFLTHGDPRLLAELEAWRSVWPDWEEFEGSMPIFWPSRLQRSDSSVAEKRELDGDSVSGGPSFLPPSISGLWNSFEKLTGRENHKYETRYQNLLSQQQKRLQNAWKQVLSVFPETNWKDFVYNWAIVNSRSFYYVSPGKEEPEDWNDALGMVPYADYFNHVDDAACDVTFNGEEYTFKAIRRYEKGEEIYMSYGPHSNDFLLVEYGFYLDDNPSDGVYLDDIILKDLTPPEKDDLAGQDCLGNFEITVSGADTNTVAAAGLKYMDRQDWLVYVAGASEKGLDKRKTADIINGWIAKYLRECEVTIDCLSEGTKTGSTESEAEKEKLDSILARWKQIQQLCETAVNAVNAIAQ